MGDRTSVHIEIGGRLRAADVLASPETARQLAARLLPELPRFEIVEA
jgi:hypothetical protein